MLRFFKNAFILCCVLLYGNISFVFCKNNDLQIYDSIIKQFQHEGNLFDAQPYGMGLINKTYLIKTKSKDGKINKYLLQNINNKTFFNINLLKMKVDLGSYKSKYFFSLQAVKQYKILDDFPKITRETLPTGVFNVKYRIHLDSIKQFEITEGDLYGQL